MDLRLEGVTGLQQWFSQQVHARREKSGDSGKRLEEASSLVNSEVEKSPEQQKGDEAQSNAACHTDHGAQQRLMPGASMGESHSLHKRHGEA